MPSPTVWGTTTALSPIVRHSVDGELPRRKLSPCASNAPLTSRVHEIEIELDNEVVSRTQAERLRPLRACSAPRLRRPFAQKSSATPARRATTRERRWSPKWPIVKGFLFYPSAPPAGAFRFALGGSYDAIDPAVMYGASVRFPQLTLDAGARWGAGSR